MERIKISPSARKCAREADIDFTGLTGTGPGGRIVKRDIDAEIQRLAQQLGLCSLAGAVRSLKNDQLSHMFPHFRHGHTKTVYHHFTHL